MTETRRLSQDAATEAGSVIRSLGYVPLDEFYITGRVLTWDHADPIPTDQQIIDRRNDVTLVNGQNYTDWKSENGGDLTLTLRRRAKEALDAQDDLNTTVRAALIEIIEYAVQTAANLNALLDAIDSAVNLAQIKAAAALIDNQPTPTLAQARNAIKARIEAGEADT